MSLTVRQYLDRAKGQTIPPLVLELILRSGKSFYIKSVFSVDDKAEMVPLRVWDLRALTQADLDAVMAAIETIKQKLPFLVSLTPEQIKNMPKIGNSGQPFAQRALPNHDQDQSAVTRPLF